MQNIVCNYLSVGLASLFDGADSSDVLGWLHPCLCAYRIFDLLIAKYFLDHTHMSTPSVPN
jgi:hypothetical protein